VAGSREEGSMMAYQNRSSDGIRGRERME